ncbi:MAG: tRNA epoxyqueuosine(34) reductase QueG [Planctomycetota bacterium]|nr:tRNA epoxyqueuosine(34) reductase QueG [Planctomycetota bacterium]
MAFVLRSTDAIASGTMTVPFAPILALCQAEGFAAAAVCSAVRVDREPFVRAWVGAGEHGAMDWFAAQLELRLDPASLLTGVKSVLCVADRYHDGRRDEVSNDPPAMGKSARYARGLDYHRRMKRRLVRIQKRIMALHPGERCRTCCDIEPILERDHAARAGIGRIGKNTMVIAPGLGSWILLGEILTTIEIEPTTPLAGMNSDPCGACTACIDACPTDALTPWHLDARRCLSHLHIEDRGITSSSFDGRTEGWIFGCDICQEVCPHNQPTRASRIAGVHPDYDGRNASLPLIDVIQWTADARASAFERGALKRITLPMARRNALLAAADWLESKSDTALESVVRDCVHDDDALVSATARRVVERLDQRVH